MGLWEDFVPLIRAGLDEQIAMGTKMSPVGVVMCTVKYEDRIALVCRYLDPTSEAYRLAQRFLNETALYLAANQAPIPPQPTIPFNNVGGVFVKPQPGGPERPMYFTTAAVLICMLSVPLATTGQALVTAMMQIYRKSGVSPDIFPVMGTPLEQCRAAHRRHGADQVPPGRYGPWVHVHCQCWSHQCVA